MVDGVCEQYSDMIVHRVILLLVYIATFYSTCFLFYDLLMHYYCVHVIGNIIYNIPTNYDSEVTV